MSDIRSHSKNDKGIGALIAILVFAIIVVVIIVAWALIWSQASSVNLSNFGEVWLAIVVIAVIAGIIIAALSNGKSLTPVNTPAPFYFLTFCEKPIFNRGIFKAFEKCR